MKKIMLKILVLGVLSLSLCCGALAMQEKQIETRVRKIDSGLIKRVLSYKRFIRVVKLLEGGLFKALVKNFEESLEGKFKKMLYSFGFSENNKGADQFEEALKYLQNLKQPELVEFISSLEKQEYYIGLLLNVKEEKKDKSTEAEMNLYKNKVANKIKEEMPFAKLNGLSNLEIYSQLLRFFIVISMAKYDEDSIFLAKLNYLKKNS